MKSCDALKVTSSDLVEASSVESRGALCSERSDNNHGSGNPNPPSIQPWDHCADDVQSHYLQSRPEPKPKPAPAPEKKTFRRLPYNNNKPAAVQRKPFKYHHDIRKYMRDYTATESHTMGQDTDYVVKYELVGPSREVYSRWRDQFGSLGVRGESVHDDGNSPGFSYTHNQLNRTTPRPQQGPTPEPTHHQDSDRQLASQLQKPTSRHVPTSVPLGFGTSAADVDDRHQGFNFLLTGFRTEPFKETKSKNKTTGRTRKLGTRPKLHSESVPMSRGGINEYHIAKQMEKDLADTIDFAEHEETIPLYGNPDNMTDVTESSEPATYRSVRKANTNQPATDERHPVFKLPPLQEHVGNMAAQEHERVQSAQKQPQQKKKRQKTSKPGGKKFTNSQQYMDFPSPRRRNNKATTSEQEDEYAYKQFQQTVPPLSSTYSKDDVLKMSRLNKKLAASGSDIELPKLHKWLSDGAVHKSWEVAETPSPDPLTHRNSNRSRMFSHEFLEYANQLKNREVVTMLYDPKQQQQQQKQSVAELERETRSLPETQRSPNHTARPAGPSDHRQTTRYEQSAVVRTPGGQSENIRPDHHDHLVRKMAQMQSAVLDTGPPPNTPTGPAIQGHQLQPSTVYVNQTQATTTQTPRPTNRRKGNNTHRQTQKVDVQTVNLFPDTVAGQPSERTNERVVEVVDKKYLSSSMTTERAVWRT